MSRLIGEYFRPGQTAPVGGLYMVVGPRGGLTGHKRFVAGGHRFPPTPKSRQEYLLVGLCTASAKALRNHRRMFRDRLAAMPNEAAGA